MKPHELLELGNFQNARILNAAVELDIFKHLCAPSTSAEVASATGLNAEFTGRLLNALVALEVIDKNGDKYSVPKSLRDALGDGTESYLPMIKHRINLWRTWNKLDEIVKAGKNYYDLTGEGRRGGDTLNSFIRAMAVAGNATALETVSSLDLTGVKKVVDIGGGPAIYAIAFCNALPDAEVYILDMPGVREIAMDFLADAGYKDRIKFITGDALTIEPDFVVSNDGEKFDLIFAGNLIHAFSYDKTRLFLERCALWVAPGGQIAVKDFYLNDDRVSPARAALFDINMLVNTPGGRCYTWSEIEGMLMVLKDIDGNPIVDSVSRIQIDDDISAIAVARILG